MLVGQARLVDLELLADILPLAERTILNAFNGGQSDEEWA